MSYHHGMPLVAVVQWFRSLAERASRLVPLRFVVFQRPSRLILRETREGQFSLERKCMENCVIVWRLVT